jgi:S-disulfanyl-L-cysteine oxidoreductase SoxD
VPGSRRAAAAMIAAVLGTILWTATAQDARRTVRDGVFSAAQAARGERLFESICTNCHELTELTAAGAYLDDVNGESLWETFDYISSDMPEDDPGSLRADEYAAVLAYVLSVYGLPSGETDLRVDREWLEAIAIVRPASPGS